MPIKKQVLFDSSAVPSDVRAGKTYYHALSAWFNKWGKQPAPTLMTGTADLLNNADAQGGSKPDTTNRTIRSIDYGAGNNLCSATITTTTRAGIVIVGFSIDKDNVDSQKILRGGVNKLTSSHIYGPDAQGYYVHEYMAYEVLNAGIYQYDLQEWIGFSTVIGSAIKAKAVAFG